MTFLLGVLNIITAAFKIQLIKCAKSSVYLPPLILSKVDEVSRALWIHRSL